MDSWPGLASGDPPHHATLDEPVVPVEQGAAHQRHHGRVPAGLLLERRDVLLGLRGVAERGQAHREQRRGAGLQRGAVPADELHDVLLVLAHVDRCSEQDAVAALQVGVLPYGDVERAGVVAVRLEYLDDVRRDRRGLPLGGPVGDADPGHGVRPPGRVSRAAVGSPVGPGRAILPRPPGWGKGRRSPEGAASMSDTPRCDSRVRRDGASLGGDQRTGPHESSSVLAYRDREPRRGRDEADPRRPRPERARVVGRADPRRSRSTPTRNARRRSRGRPTRPTRWVPPRHAPTSTWPSSSGCWSSARRTRSGSGGGSSPRTPRSPTCASASA